MVSADDAAAVDGKGDSCNGNEAAVLASQLGAGESMQVDSDGNFIIPQVDGPADILMDDDGGEEESEEQPAVDEPAESVPEENLVPNEMEEEEGEPADQLAADPELRLQEALPEEGDEEPEEESKPLPTPTEEALPLEGGDELPVEFENNEDNTKLEDNDESENRDEQEKVSVKIEETAAAAAAPLEGDQLTDEPSLKITKESLSVEEKNHESEPEPDNSQEDEEEATDELGTLQLEPEANMSIDQSDSDNVSQADSHPVVDDAASQDSQNSQNSQQVDTAGHSKTDEEMEAEPPKLSIPEPPSPESKPKVTEEVNKAETQLPTAAEPAIPAPTDEPLISPKLEAQDEPMDEDEDEYNESNDTSPVKNAAANATNAVNATNPTTNGVAIQPVVKTPGVLKNEPKNDKEAEVAPASGDSTALTTLATAALGSAGQPVKVKAEMVSQRLF